MPNNCDTLQLKDDLCKTSNDLVEYVTLTTGTTTNYGLVPLKVEISTQLAAYVFPTEVTYNKQAIDDRIKSLVSASGFTTKVKSKDRFLETDTPNVLVDKVGDDYIIDGVLYSQLGDELVDNNNYTEIFGGVVEDNKIKTDNGRILIPLGNLNGYFKLNTNLLSNGSNTYLYITSASSGSTSGLQVPIEKEGDNDSRVGKYAYYKLDIDEYYLVVGCYQIDEILKPNVSVKDLKTITKPLAPFDPSSNDSLETTIINTKAYNKADIIVCQADDKIYQVIVTNTIIGDLSTDTNKFQVINDITRHDIVVMTANDYKTFKGIKFYENIELVDKDTIASDRGWTKIGTNTYIDEDGEKCFIVGIFPSANSKMYHEQYNKKGSFQNANNEFWYNDSTPSTSIYETINKAVNNVSGRPDGLIPTKAYLNGEFGIKTMGYSYAFDNIIFEEEKNINKSSSFNEYLKTETLTGASSTTWVLTEKAQEIHEVLYSLDSGTTWAIQTFTPDYINNSVILGTARDYILVSYTAYDASLKADAPTKILEEYSFVLSNNSYDIEKSNLIMNLVSGIVQTGNNTTNTELAITKVIDDVFSYTDDSTNTNPTAVYFLGLMSNNEYCIGVYGSANNLIDKSTTYIKRLGVYKK